MQCFYMRRCVELTLTCAVVKAFAGSSSILSILQAFYDFDVLKQLGTTFAIFLVLTGIFEISHATFRWAKSFSNRSS
jgi:ethanolamine transporter EutH